MSDSAIRCNEGHVHKWPEAGKMTVYPCERRCQYCTDHIKTYNQGSHLRAHVRDFHAKAKGSHPDIQVQPGIMGRMAKYRDCPGTVPEEHHTPATTPTDERNAAKVQMRSEASGSGSETDTPDVRPFRFRFAQPGATGDFASHRAGNDGIGPATPAPLEVSGASLFEIPKTTGSGSPIDGYLVTPTTASMRQRTDGLADGHYQLPYGQEPGPSMFGNFTPANLNSDRVGDAAFGWIDSGVARGRRNWGEVAVDWDYGMSTDVFNDAFATELRHLLNVGKELGYSKVRCAELVCDMMAAELEDE